MIMHRDRPIKSDTKKKIFKLNSRFSYSFPSQETKMNSRFQHLAEVFADD